MRAADARRLVEAAASMRSFDWVEVRDRARALLEPPPPPAGQMTFDEVDQ